MVWCLRGIGLHATSHFEWDGVCALINQIVGLKLSHAKYTCTEALDQLLCMHDISLVPMSFPMREKGLVHRLRMYKIISVKLPVYYSLPHDNLTSSQTRNTMCSNPRRV